MEMGEPNTDKNLPFPNSWVMLSDSEGFIRLPNEHIIYTSPPRTSLSLKAPSAYSSKESFSMNCSNGRVYLTNQRVRAPL
jgi:WW domain-binding protein 2